MTIRVSSTWCSIASRRWLTHVSKPIGSGTPHNIKKPNVTHSTTKEERWDPTRIRNIGIMAHIDAGKTTTTERMLHLSGATEAMGNVDSGDTVTDYMAQERERGITITSAAVTFYWNHHRINLIDTPGHVDFTVEVERCVRVLDGTVTVLDAAAGVEAQTVTVWRQAEKYGVPTIIYLNKMDKPNASVKMCLQSITDSLRIKPLLLYKPDAEGKSFRSFTDPIRLLKWQWSEDPKVNSCQKSSIEAGSHDFDAVIAHRLDLFETLADCDDSFAETLLSKDSRLVPGVTNSIPTDKVIEAIRRVTIGRKAVPVCVGSSLKNRGVEVLLNDVCHFLPAPSDRSHAFLHYYANHFCGLAFKITHQKHKGPLTFVRLYSGDLRPGTELYNVNRDRTEFISKLFIPHSDEMQEVPIIHAGNIGVLGGLKHSVTGDTLVQSKKLAESVAEKFTNDRFKANGEEEMVLSSEDNKPVLVGIEAPQPVFFCAIEPNAHKDEKTLTEALRCLQREDPSLRVREDPETQQTILEGMGELHIEIIKDRLLREWKIETYVGPLQVNYREGIEGVASHQVTLSEFQNQSRNEITIGLTVGPAPKSGKFRKIEFDHTADTERPLNTLRRDWVNAVNDGIESACRHGPMLSYQVEDLRVVLKNFVASRGISLALISAAATQCASEAFGAAGSHILEPIVQLDVQVDQQFGPAVTRDLHKRRALIDDASSQGDNGAYRRHITAKVPLAEMIGYVTTLRTLSSGTAHLHMTLLGYQKMSAEVQRKTIEKFSGGRR